jgi:hypothetical protein
MVVLLQARHWASSESISTTPHGEGANENKEWACSGYRHQLSFFLLFVQLCHLVYDGNRLGNIVFLFLYVIDNGFALRWKVRRGQL